MTKAEQTRLRTWRLKVLQRAGAGWPGMIRLEAAREIKQQPAGGCNVGAAIGAVQDRFHPRALPLRQVIEDVAQLVHLAGLDECDIADEIAHCFPLPSKRRCRRKIGAINIVDQRSALLD